jgi:hypothetical protein
MLLPRGGSSDAAMLRVSVDIARAYPRDEVKVLKTVLAALDAFPESADEMLYSITYNKGKDNEVDVEGLTIRAAETLKSAWGHLRVGARLLHEDDYGWDLEAVVFDMEKNNWELTPSRATKLLKRRDGRVETLDERGQIQALGAAVSKAKRNAILAMLPLHLKAAFEARVREHLAGGSLTGAADPVLVKRCIEAFAKDYKVSEARLVARLDKPRARWTGQDLVKLRAIFTSLTQGEQTVEQAFPPVTPPPAPDPATTGRVIETKTGALTPEEKHVAPPPPAPVVPGGVPYEEVQKPDPTIPVPEPRAPSAPPPETYHDPVWEAIEAATSPLELQALQGRLYTPGDEWNKLPRERKRAALTRIQAKRDALAASA